MKRRGGGSVNCFRSVSLNQHNLSLSIVDVAQRMVREGLIKGTSGNVSIRFGDGFLITPSGMDYADMLPNDIVSVGFDGIVRGGGKPSSEWCFHRDIYAERADSGAIVHCHSAFATTLATLRMGIPAFHYMVAIAGGTHIRCADYATFGTQTLSDNILEAIQGHRACLMANHGQVAFGEDINQAFKVAVEVESLSEQYVKALQLGGPVLLNDDEMERVLEKFKTY